MDRNISVDESLNDDEIYLPALYAVDVLLLLSNLTAISVNGVIIYILLKYRLQSSTNKFVLNWCILDILHLLTSPGIYKWYGHIHEIFDYILEIQYCVLFVSFEIGVLLLLLALLFKDNMNNFKEKTTYIIGIVWFITVFCFTISDLIVVNVEEINILIPILTFLALHVLLLIVIIVKYVIKCVKKTIYDDDRKLRMYLVTCFACFWWQLLLMIPFGRIHPLLLPCFLSFAELNVFANLFLLIAFDQHFKISLYKLFNKSTQNYDDEINFISESEIAEETIS